MKTLIVSLSAFFLLVLVPVASAEEIRLFPIDKPGPKPSGFYDFSQLGTEEVQGLGTIPRFNCTVSQSSQPSDYAGNMLLDCEGEEPHNETTIVVDPNDPDHAVGAFHTYLLNFNGATVTSHVVGTPSVTFDGGVSWKHVFPPITPYQFTGDPALTFAASGRLYFANIADHEGPGGPYTGPSVVVQSSDDGGLTWTNPVTVARGQAAVNPGTDAGPSVFNDKEFIAADTNPLSPFANRVYISWTRFAQKVTGRGLFFNSPIYLSYSDDGKKWSTGKAISGFSPDCNAQLFGAPYECDLNQFSYPAVSPTGKVYVSFENFNTEAENQIMVVSSSNGGKNWTSPVRVDMVHDINFPANSVGSDTVTGCNFRVSAKANTAVDPSDPTGNTVYVVWADNQNGSEDATNMDVFLGKSTDGGASWATITVDAEDNDQFYPWVAVGPDGKVSVGYMDRFLATGADQTECKYGFALSRLGADGSALGKTRVDTGASDPGNSRWFNLNSRFIGDYNGVAVGPDGTTWSLWTDQRAPVEGDADARTGQHAVAGQTGP